MNPGIIGRSDAHEELKKYRVKPHIWDHSGRSSQQFFVLCKANAMTTSQGKISSTSSVLLYCRYLQPGQVSFF